MRRHTVLVASLHALAALFVAGCVAIVWIGAALLAPMFEGSFVPGLVAAVGRPVGIVLSGIAAIDLIAAVAVLRKPSIVAGRVLMVVSVPLLFVFPIGSALAVYTWWAFGTRPRPTA